jgi:hypothetical protein
VINKLEDAGAVWLEKRRGFPYDYTVLLVDSEHPDVRQIQEELANRSPGDYNRGYYREPYDDEVGFEEEEGFERQSGYPYGNQGDSDEEAVDSKSERNID